MRINSHRVPVQPLSPHSQISIAGPGFEGVRDAAAVGIATEEDNAALYDRLFASTEREDILHEYRAGVGQSAAWSA